MGYNTPKQTVSQFQLKGRYARHYLAFAEKSSKDCWNCVFSPESPDINWDWIPLPTSLAALPIPL